MKQPCGAVSTKPPAVAEMRIAPALVTLARGGCAGVLPTAGARTYMMPRQWYAVGSLNPMIARHSSATAGGLLMSFFSESSISTALARARSASARLVSGSYTKPTNSSLQ